MPKTFTGARSGATYVIHTNNHRRAILDGWELTPDERERFDYIDWSAIERGEDSASFVRYRGDLIDLGDVPRTDHGGDLDSAGWSGFTSETYSSGLVFRYAIDDNSEDAVIVGRVYTTNDDTQMMGHVTN